LNCCGFGHNSYDPLATTLEITMKTTEDLVRIVSFGGGVVIDASKTTEELVRIASFAAGKGSRVIIKHAGRKTTEDLVRIASFGKGSVLFDLSD
jgi:predicted RNA-binding protein YlxR (DUF448 family)